MNHLIGIKNPFFSVGYITLYKHFNENIETILQMIHLFIVFFLLQQANWEWRQLEYAHTDKHKKNDDQLSLL